MFGLAKEKEITRPLPETITRLLTVDAHDAVSERLGIFCAAREDIKLKNFLFENGIPLFDYVAVHTYLGEQAKKAKMGWKWVALREKDKPDQGFDDQSAQTVRVLCDYIESKIRDKWTREGWIISSTLVYKELVPLPHLLNAEKIQQAFPKARFFVSEISNRQERYPDPFIMVILPNVGIYVFGVWDEPGFGD